MALRPNEDKMSRAALGALGLSVCCLAIGCSSVAHEMKVDPRSKTRTLVVMPPVRVGVVEGDAVIRLEEMIRGVAPRVIGETKIDVLPRDTTMVLLQEQGIPHRLGVDASGALSAAKQMHADYFVDGTISNADGNIVLVLQMHDARGTPLSAVRVEAKAFRELYDALYLQTRRLFHSVALHPPEQRSVAKNEWRTGDGRTLQCEPFQIGTKPFVAADARRADDLWLATRDGDVYRFDGAEARPMAALKSRISALSVQGDDWAVSAGEETIEIESGAPNSRVAFQIDVPLVRSHGPPERTKPAEVIESLGWDWGDRWAAGATSASKRDMVPTIWRRQSLFTHGGWWWGEAVRLEHKRGERFTGIHVRGNTLYAVGTDGIALRLEDNWWKPVRGLEEDDYNAVWVNAENDVWVAGRERLQHWNGSRWSSSPIGADSIACTEPKMCFATSGGRPYGWSGSEWVPIQMEGDGAVGKVFALGAERVWFVGGREGKEGTVMSCKLI